MLAKFLYGEETEIHRFYWCMKARQGNYIVVAILPNVYNERTKTELKVDKNSDSLSCTA